MPGLFHRDPAGTCGCHRDDCMAEGSDVMLDWMDPVMKDEFNAKMLGRVCRGQLTEVKFLTRTIRWHEQEMCFSCSGDTIRHKARRCAVWTYGHSSCDEDTSRRSRCPGVVGYFADSNLPLIVGIVRLHLPGQTCLSVCGESGKASGQVPGGAHGTRMALAGAGCSCEVRGVWRLNWAGSKTRRSTTRAFEQLGLHPIEFSSQFSWSLRLEWIIN